MTAQLPHKRNYHPLVCLLYMHGMLTDEQSKQLPKTTQYYWNNYSHQDHFGYEWIAVFLEDFQNIQAVFKRQHLLRTVKLLIILSNGYCDIMNQITSSKSLLRKHASSVVQSIREVAEFTKIPIGHLCRYYGVSKDWYYRQASKINCSKSPLKICYRQHPQQLTVEETIVIENAVKAPENFGKPKIYIYYGLLRKGLLFCGKSTFNKYANHLGYIKPKRMIKVRKQGFKANRIFQWLHVDITYHQTVLEGSHKVAYVKDNFSKGLLHVKSTIGKADSHFIRSLFEETFEKYGLLNCANPINILSDGGSENKGALIQWVDSIDAPPVVKKITARTDEFPWSNSMSESIHRKYKTEFMKGQLSQTIAEDIANIERFMTYTNYESFPYDLHGLCPMEVLEGQMPDKDRFRDQIDQARKDRIEVNRKYNQCQAMSLLKS